MNQQPTIEQVWTNIYNQLDLVYKKKIEDAKLKFKREKDEERLSKKN